MRLNKTGRPARVGQPLSRRRLLTCIAGLATAPVFSPLSAFAATTAKLIGSWPTGNQTLTPFTYENGILHIAGDKTVAAWKLGRDKPLWQHKIKSPAAFRPRLGKDIVLTAGRKQMTAWELGTGKHLWSLKPAKDRQFTVPLIHNSRIHFGEGHEIHTLDASTGKQLWSYPTTPSASSAYAPTAYNDLILFGPGNGILYALSAGSGKLIWKVDRGHDWQYLRQLHMDGDILVAGGYKEHAYGLSIEDGRQIWRYYAGNFINSHLVSDGMVFFWSPTGWIYALDAKNGKRLWRHRTTDYKKKSRKKNWAPVMAELVADDKFVYVLAMDRVLHVLDRKTGNKAGDYHLPVSVRPFVCLTGKPGKVILGSNAGDILYFDLN